MIVVFIDLVLAAVLLYIGVTQVILPLWREVPLFPMFRREKVLRHELAEATEEVVEAELENQIAVTNQKAETVRRRTHRPTQSTTEPGKTASR